MPNFIDFLNDSNILTENCTLVSFDTENVFPSIDNDSGLQAVKKAPESQRRTISTCNNFLCIIEAFELCLKCNDSMFNKKHFLQNDGTVQSPHRSCSHCH